MILIDRKQEVSPRIRRWKSEGTDNVPKAE
jgi:hypothetical protein